MSTIWGDLLWVDGAGRAAATSTSSSSWQGWTRRWAASRWPACWTGGSGGWPGRASTGMRRSGPPHQGPAQRGAAGLQPPAGGPARAGGAVDRASGQRLVAAPLARAAVPGPRRLPGHGRTDLPPPLAAPDPRMTEASRTPSINRAKRTARRGRSSPPRGASRPRFLRPTRPPKGTCQRRSRRSAGERYAPRGRRAQRGVPRTVPRRGPLPGPRSRRVGTGRAAELASEAARAAGASPSSSQIRGVASARGQSGARRAHLRHPVKPRMGPLSGPALWRSAGHSGLDGAALRPNCTAWARACNPSQ